MQSTLHERAEPGRRVLRGHTQLDDGSWLMEVATLDESGRLLHAQVDRGGPCSEQPTLIELDAERGIVEVSSPELYTRWSVPTDLPWVPVGLFSSEVAAGELATPVSMTIALRSASAQPAARLVDLAHHTSASIMSDQLLVADGSETTVVLGDDYADVEAGLPRHLHLAALGRDLEVPDLHRSQAWARLCRKHDIEAKTL